MSDEVLRVRVRCLVDGCGKTAAELVESHDGRLKLTHLRREYQQRDGFGRSLKVFVSGSVHIENGVIPAVEILDPDDPRELRIMCTRHDASVVLLVDPDQLVQKCAEARGSGRISDLPASAVLSSP